ncbi:MAG: nucleotide sugar dehydrogenase [Ignavibacteriaceae bacterium]|nr:nucleotide sugar dehydrogenase [Ignavibacteriaceae bacterium]
MNKSICCIGAGYVGGPTMVVIAAKCPDYKITVVDINQERINAWNSDNLPIYEPGLDEIVKQVRGKNLFFSTDIPSAVREADIIFISVNTPTKTFGEGAGKASDLQYLEKTARSIVEYAESDKIVVEKSTLPVKTAEALNAVLNSNDKNLRFDVVSNPEFLAEGTAVQDLLNPDRVLVGSYETESGIRARQTVIDIYKNWVPAERIVASNVWSSELTKLVANAFLAQRISSINSISALCEKTGADITELSRAIGMDTRIGSKFLNASIGFGGSCFKKDILNLVYICDSLGLPEVARYWESVVDMNDYQTKRFVQRMIANMFNTLAGKRITLFGFAFKADTGDTRESQAIAVARHLIEEKAQVVITDPKALENAKQDLKEFASSIIFEEDPYKAAEGSDAVAVMTEWKLYRTLDYKKIYKTMRKPAFVFDGRNILQGKELQETGFHYFGIGRIS